MKTTIYNLLFAGLFISAVAFSGCSKSSAINDLNNNAKKVAAEMIPPHANILNQNLGISSARDNGADITAQFKDFTFKFVGAYPSGEAQVWNDLLAQTGTWSSGELANDFTINYPTNIFQQLAFLNKTWVEEGSSSAVIRLVSGDGDEVHFSPK